MATDTVPASLSHRHPTELALRQPYLLQPSFDRRADDDDDATALTLSDLLGMVLSVDPDCICADARGSE